MASSRSVGTMLAVMAVSMIWIGSTYGHCDTMDGPVVKDGKTALESGEAAAILKWVGPKQEAEIKAALARTLAVRNKGAEAKELADLYFLETLVRLHRAHEGAPYTGLKPAGTEVNPAVQAADQALASGSAEALVKLVSDQVAQGIAKRFEAATSAQKHAGHNVEAGRAFVQAYVEFTHYVERLYNNATAAGHDAHAASAEPGTEAEHAAEAPAGHDQH